MHLVPRVLLNPDQESGSDAESDSSAAEATNVEAPAEVEAPTADDIARLKKALDAEREASKRLKAEVSSFRQSQEQARIATMSAEERATELEQRLAAYERESLTRSLVDEALASLGTTHTADRARVERMVKKLAISDADELREEVSFIVDSVKRPSAVKPGVPATQARSDKQPEAPTFDLKNPPRVSDNF